MLRYNRSLKKSKFSFPLNFVHPILVLTRSISHLYTCLISHLYVHAQSRTGMYMLNLSLIYMLNLTLVYMLNLALVYMLRIFLLCIFKLFLLCMFNLILVYTWIHAQSLNYIPAGRTFCSQSCTLIDELTYFLTVSSVELTNL